MRSAGFRISPVKPAARSRRRSRLSVIGSPPLPLLTPYAAACAPGSFWRYGRPWRASPLGDGLHHMAAESPCRESGKTR